MDSWDSLDYKSLPTWEVEPYNGRQYENSGELVLPDGKALNHYGSRAKFTTLPFQYSGAMERKYIGDDQFENVIVDQADYDKQLEEYNGNPRYSITRRPEGNDKYSYQQATYHVDPATGKLTRLSDWADFEDTPSSDAWVDMAKFAAIAAGGYMAAGAFAGAGAAGAAGAGAGASSAGASAGAGIGQAGVTHLTPALMESAMVGGQAAGYGISSASLGNLMGAGTGAGAGAISVGGGSGGGAASSSGASKMFGSTFKDAFAQNLGSQAASSLFGDKGSSTATSKLDLSPEGYNKIIRDILASDEGLASLATGENLSGGYGSSTKAQLAQDLVLNIAGELAKLTAPKTESKTSSSKKKLSVICTELNRQGYLSDELYEEGKEHFNKLPIETLTGYRVWADKLVPKMQRSQALTKFFAPIAQARYELVVQKRFSLLGAATIYLGQPICYVIGCIVLAMRGDKDGDISETA